MQPERVNSSAAAAADSWGVGSCKRGEPGGVCRSVAVLQGEAVDDRGGAVDDRGGVESPVAAARET